MKKNILSALIIIAGALGAHAQSSVIVWSAPQTIAGASDVVNAGTLYGTWAPGDLSSASYPVNGVTFAPISLPDFSFSGIGNHDFAGFGSPGTTSANYNQLLDTGDYSNTFNNPGSVVGSFSWGGMTPGDTYEVQLWVEDVRDLGFLRYEYISGGTTYGVDTSSALDFPGNGSGNGTYITGTFVANGSGTETIGFTPGSSVANQSIAQFNLFQVRDLTTPVPEPRQYAALFLAAAFSLMAGRQIRRRFVIAT